MSLSTFSSSCQRISSVATSKASSSLFASHASAGKLLQLGHKKNKGNMQQVLMSSLLKSTSCQVTHLGISSRCRNMILRLWLPLPRSGRVSRINWNMRLTTWLLGGGSAGICVCSSSSEPVYADSGKGNDDEIDKSPVSSYHGKKVYTDYSITGIPGDGRCLFRSVAHGACIGAGKPLPDEKLQRKLADELREQVAEEFIKRRTETEWFIEGNFDEYVSHIRKPRVWGGEPELLMSSHVLKMPITVFMHDRDSGGLISIAEYGQEYGKENPIRVLYHGYGHYDALQIPGRKGPKSRL